MPPRLTRFALLPLAGLAMLAPSALSTASVAHAQAKDATALCNAPVAGADASELAGTGDEVIRGELQERALLRSGPDGRCTGTIQVPAAATVKMLGCDDAWCLVAYGQDVGFVPAGMLDYLPDRVPDLR